jgi:HEAT repeat protein
VTLLFVLGVIAVAQGVFVVLLGLFIVTRRTQVARRRTRIKRGRAKLSWPLAQWLIGDASPDTLVKGLRTLPRDAALAYASELHDVRVPVNMRRVLGRAMRHEAWAKWAIAGATSRRWWRRLDASRALGLVGSADDAGVLRPLLDDEHPAVRLAATQALEAVADPALIRLAIQHYPVQPLAVRLFTTSTLRIIWDLVDAPLGEALATRDAAPSDLVAWLALAESLSPPALRGAVTALAGHSDADVRAAAARTLRRYPHRESVDAVMALLDDPQDFVRAASAQALGALRATEAEPRLERGLADDAWWVRFRSALALAMMGESGRAALRRARQSADPYARDMALMTSGLTEGAVLELADA